MECNKLINNLIENSGMITHHKVINSLRKNGWNVLIGPYYYDNIVNVVREIDIIAEKQFNSSDNARDSNVQINAQLFLECKYIKQEIIFWFDKKDIDSAVSKLEKDTDLSIHYNKPSADILANEFHYLNNNKVAKLFSTNTNKDDVIYKAITQCLNAKIYYDQWLNRSISLGFAEHGRSDTSIMKYPVIICDNFDKFIEVDFNDNEYKHKKINENFQLEINYVHLDKLKTSSISDYFLIDVVDFNDLDNFLGNIEKEIKSIINSKSFILRRNDS